MPVILITGSSGQLGSELKVVADNYYGYDFVFTDVAELDITDREKTVTFIRQLNPDWIINCAAYTQVDRAENDEKTAALVNSDAVANIIESIKETGCRLIHISTDYVYNGISPFPFNELSEPAPASVYGRTKLAGEYNALRHPAAMIIRTSWLYSSFGANFVRTILKNAAVKDSLRVVYDQTGSPTYAADLATSILNIISSVIRNHVAFNAGIFNYSNEGVCSWYDFAIEILKEAGMSCRIDPILTAEYPTPAKRPAYSVMDKSKIRETYGIEISHWRDSLIKCIKLMQL